MTKQEIFDTSALHLLNQNKKSLKLDNNEFCMYRGPEGLQCAIGPLIPDSKYSKKMENMSAKTLMSNYPMLKEHLGGNLELLIELQDVHDNCSVGEWLTELKGVARANKLNLKAIRRWEKENR